MSTDSQLRRADEPLDAGEEMSYVYALGRVGEPALRDAVARLAGVDGRALRLVESAGLAAVVSSVPSGAFGEQGLRTQLEDMARLEVIARSHHAVVDAAFAGTTVLPMRLATVYLDDARVAEMLTARRGRFLDLLDRLDGHVELGMKVYADAGAVTPPKAEGEAEAVAESPGRAYLRRRRAQRRSIQDLHRAAADAAEEAVRVAEGLSSARVVHRPQQGGLAPARGENIANEAYLVPTGEVGRFMAALGASADATPGVRVEVTGPWAPYSFATVAEEDRYGTEEGGGR
ncbi:GvpL/GvpF family gas vesicle protein [Streptomyces sp. TLI_105]|uniref:GvpL/GvpF family gas vesicle protein n=1 Tax=Streptomyces sp. TLI_105 TaxID=1881019 RepID=UPI000894E497|nr:GvpL/GvpF family gas vesicle protein [Streptomyces sp. TLI_105]SEC11239.1 Gas vesicle synthesis protein GvpL/GvpF [Streptomyces sp. TLI_105]